MIDAASNDTQFLRPGNTDEVNERHNIFAVSTATMTRLPTLDSLSKMAVTEK
jgi:hypothetical protein